LETEGGGASIGSGEEEERDGEFAVL